jgi:hypothetical protein
MIPTVAEVTEEIQSLLGDVEGRVFDSALALIGFKRAYRQLRQQMIKDQLPGVVSVVTFTVPASTTTLTPAAAGISNFGELIEIAERTPGTTESFVPMVELGTMATTDPATTLGWFEWREESFQFYGSSVTREVRIRYYDSGVPPTSGSVGIDGSLDFLAHFGAAAIGPSRGYDSAEILRLRTLAMGERLDGSGGMLYDLIQPMVRSLQRVQRQPRPYGAGAYSWKRSRPPLYIAAPPAEGGVTQIFSIAGSIDGVNTTFTLSAYPQHLDLYNNGLLQYPDVAYTRTGPVVTFLVGYIPQTGDLLRAEGIV